MPRVCLVCSHPDREAIDRALVAGESPSSLSARYCTIGRMAFTRHKAEHLPASLVKAQEAEDVAHGIDLHQQLKAANSLAWQVAKEARDAHDGELALKALDRVLKQLDLVAELAEAIDRRPVVNVLVSPEWLTVRSALVGVLATYPEARAAVASRLLALEAGNGHSG